MDSKKDCDKIEKLGIKASLFLYSEYLKEIAYLEKKVLYGWKSTG